MNDKTHVIFTCECMHSPVWVAAAISEKKVYTCADLFSSKHRKFILFIFISWKHPRTEIGAFISNFGAYYDTCRLAKFYQHEDAVCRVWPAALIHGQILVEALHAIFAGHTINGKWSHMQTCMSPCAHARAWHGPGWWRAVGSSWSLQVLEDRARTVCPHVQLYIAFRLE